MIAACSLALVLTAVLANLGVEWYIIVGLWAGIALALLAVFKPLIFLGLFVAEVLLVPITAGVSISSELPVLFPSRLLAMVGIVGAILRHWLVAKPMMHWNPLTVPLVLILLGAGASVPLSVDTRLSLFKLLSLLFEWLGVVFITWQALASQSRQASLRLLNWILFVLAVACLLGIVEAATGFNLNQVLTTGYTPYYWFGDTLIRGGWGRVRATFVHPIEWGGTLAFVLPVALALWLHARKMWWWFYGVVTVLMLINVGLAISLGPLVGLLIGLSIMCTLGQGQRTILAGGYMLTLGTAILASYGPLQPVFAELLLERLSSTAGSFTNIAGRIAILLAAWEAVHLYPVFGSGLNTWFIINPSATYMGVSNTGGGGGNENYYAQAFVETGVVGLCSLMLALVLLLREVWKHRRQQQPAETKTLMTGLFSAMLGFYVLNFTANVLGAGGAQPATAFWLVVTCCLRYAQSDKVSIATKIRK